MHELVQGCESSGGRNWMAGLRDAFVAGRAQVDRLGDPSELLEAARQVAGLAQSSGASHLLAASPYAERIVGAAMLLDGANLHGALCANVGHELTGRTVLIVDIMLASGTAMASAARTARRCGAARVDGAVFHLVTGAVRPEDCGVDDLKVLGG
jgi:phosphoribosylpyrophosphate synthetase